MLGKSRQQLNLFWSAMPLVLAGLILAALSYFT